MSVYAHASSLCACNFRPGPQQIGLLLPLSLTGIFWGILYINSANLLVPVLIHAMWNARIFLGSYLGL